MEYTSRRKRKINKSMKTIRIKKRKEELWCPWWSGKRENTTVWTKGEQKGTKIFWGFKKRSCWWVIRKLLCQVKSSVIGAAHCLDIFISHSTINTSPLSLGRSSNKSWKIFFVSFFQKKICFPPIEVKKRTLSSQIYQALIYQLPASLLLDYSSIIHFFSLPSTIDRLEETNFLKIFF